MVNDIVKVFADYNTTLTKDEDEKQFFYHVAEQNRKIVSTDTTKKSLLDVVINKKTVRN